MIQQYGQYISRFRAIPRGLNARRLRSIGARAFQNQRITEATNSGGWKLYFLPFPINCARVTLWWGCDKYEGIVDNTANDAFVDSIIDDG